MLAAATGWKGSTISASVQKRYASSSSLLVRRRFFLLGAADGRAGREPRDGVGTDWNARTGTED